MNFSSLSHRRGRIKISRKFKGLEIVLAESSNRELDFNFISNTGYENCVTQMWNRHLTVFPSTPQTLSSAFGQSNRELQERMRIIRRLAKPSRMLLKIFSSYSLPLRLTFDWRSFHLHQARKK